MNLGWTYRNVRRLVVTLIGATVVLFGVALLVLPGPGILVILVGLAILATEWVWARRLLRRFKTDGQAVSRSVRDLLRRGRPASSGTGTEPPRKDPPSTAR
ncbi:MAG: PGPGW domain-containing protein [Acidobacteriota bacterium]